VPITSAAILAWPFRGREAELALIAQAVDDLAVAGMVVAGEAGGQDQARAGGAGLLGSRLLIA
jgi:hypothetical protein